MTPEQRELFRFALLRVLDANDTRFALTLTAIAHLVAPYGFVAEPSSVQRELLYLEDKGLLTRPNKLISPEVSLWRLTAAGRDWIASNG